MTYQEKQSLVNIISALLITAIYSVNIYQRHIDGVFDLTSDFKVWGIIFLIFMGVSIVARIIIYIIFHIINAIATNEEDIPVTDERDKLIKLKSARNSYIIFAISFIVSFILLALNMPVYGMFIVFVIGGLFAEIIENSSQIYFYRKGL